MKLKIALAQLNSTHDPSSNLEITKKALQKAKKRKSDLVLFPELWTISYTDFPDDDEEKISWKSKAMRENHRLFKEYKKLAKDIGIAYTLNFLESNEKGTEFYNASFLINDNGRVVSRYRKTHPVDKGWERMLTAGNTFEVANLKTKKGTIKVGTMICYDREFPEVARLLMLEGAELILTPNACTLENNRLAQFQARGFENMLCVAMTNYPAPKNNGMSVAFDGMRKRGEEYNPQLIRMNDKASIGYFELDVKKLRAYRNKEIWGDAYRRPALYKKLTVNNPSSPFIRGNARRNKK